MGQLTDKHFISLKPLYERSGGDSGLSLVMLEGALWGSGMT